MASYIVEDDQSSKVLHKLFCKIINLLWLKVLAFFQWRYLRLFILQMWFKLAFRGWSFLLSYPHTGFLVCRPHQALLSFIPSSIVKTYRFVFLVVNIKKLEMRFTSYLPSFPSCSELDPLHSHEKMRDERVKDRLMILYNSDSS